VEVVSGGCPGPHRMGVALARQRSTSSPSPKGVVPPPDDATYLLVPNSPTKCGSPVTEENREAMRAQHTKTCMSHLRAPWTERIPWYPLNGRPYSRRELLADAIIHAFGTCLTLGAIGYLFAALSSPGSGSTPLLAWSMAIYIASLLGMFIFSSIYNIGLGHWGGTTAGFKALSNVDHAGICLLIAGTYTPIMTAACCLRTLALVWALAAFTIGTKVHGGRLNTLVLHVPCFVLMGWSCMFVWSSVVQTYSDWSCRMFVLGGIVYTVGLLPWGAKRFEYHVCLWHVHVISGSACIFFALVHDLPRLPLKVSECVASF